MCMFNGVSHCQCECKYRLGIRRKSVNCEVSSEHARLDVNSKSQRLRLDDYIVDENAHIKTGNVVVIYHIRIFPPFRTPPFCAYQKNSPRNSFDMVTVLIRTTICASTTYSNLCLVIDFLYYAEVCVFSVRLQPMPMQDSISCVIVSCSKNQSSFTYNMRHK